MAFRKSADGIARKGKTEAIVALHQPFKKAVRAVKAAKLMPTCCLWDVIWQRLPTRNEVNHG
jgi:hypothetical protein